MCNQPYRLSDYGVNTNNQAGGGYHQAATHNLSYGEVNPQIRKKSTININVARV